MKISIIIPTFKPQQYLFECLNSLKNQSIKREDFEIILILNGCKEPYYGTIKSYIDNELKGYNIRFIQTDVPGVSNARNVGLDIASGEFITFIDDDDYVSCRFLEDLYVRASSNSVVLCCPKAFIDNGAEIRDYRKTLDFLSNKTRQHLSINQVRRFFSGPCMKLIPMKIIGKRRFDVSFKNGEDSIFMFLISDRIKYVDFSSGAAIYFRRFREGSAFTSRKTFSYELKNSIRMIHAYVKIFLKGGYSFTFFTTRILGAVKSLLLG